MFWYRPHHGGHRRAAAEILSSRARGGVGIHFNLRIGLSRNRTVHLIEYPFLQILRTSILYVSYTNIYTYACRYVYISYTTPHVCVS